MWRGWPRRSGSEEPAWQRRRRVWSMGRSSRIAMGLAGLVAAGGVFFLVLPGLGIVVREVWTRGVPLVAPLVATSVHDGAITLADGRTFRLAGVARREGVPAAEYDGALRAMVAQGVVVVRDLGNGSALLVGEPRFHNWCGTHRGWTHWAGALIQCPLSELLVLGGWADANPTESGLTSREAWRIEGVVHAFSVSSRPRRVLTLREGPAIDFSSDEWALSDQERCDRFIEDVWKAPP